MKILYFSTHEPLEYDDIHLFRRMGHTIFSLGKYCPALPQTISFRPPIAYEDQATQDLVEMFHREECKCEFMNVAGTVLTEAFVNAFDFVISIQAVGFIAQNWHLFSTAIPVWRTVGQAIEHHDLAAAPFRDKGLKIVRWSTRERYASIYIGHDAIVRASKDPENYCGWHGNEEKVLTFSNHLLQRYPIEGAMLARMLHDVPYEIGGAGNENVKNAIGLLSFAGMIAKLKSARAYFYGHGCVVPYTLNFIEAWMTGIPVIAARKDVEIDNIDMKYNEINDFMVHNVNGFLYKSEIEANILSRAILSDKNLAEKVGSEGRKMAIRIFGIDRAAADWQLFFDASVNSRNRPKSVA